MSSQSQANATVCDDEQAHCSCQKYHGFQSCIRNCTENKRSRRRTKTSAASRRARSQETFERREEERGTNGARIGRVQSCSPGRRPIHSTQAEDLKSLGNEEIGLVGKQMPTSPRVQEERETREESRLAGRTERRIPQNTPVQKELLNGGKKGGRLPRPLVAAAQLENVEINVAEILSFDVRRKSLEGETSRDSRCARDRKHRTTKTVYIRTPPRAEDATRKLKRRSHCVANVWRFEPRKRRNVPAAKTELPNLRFFRRKSGDVRIRDAERSGGRRFEGLLLCNAVHGSLAGVGADTRRMIDEMINGESLPQRECGEESEGTATDAKGEMIDLSFAEACQVFMIKNTRGSIEELPGAKFPQQRRRVRSASKKASEEALNHKRRAPGPTPSKPLVRAVTLKLSPRVERQTYVQRALRAEPANKINSAKLAGT